MWRKNWGFRRSTPMNPGGTAVLAEGAGEGRGAERGLEESGGNISSLLIG